MIRKVLMFAGSMLALSIMSSAQSVGISSTVITPDASSMLEIQATNKGLLMPRVALTATNAAGPISSPATSLMVYNTATASSGATAVYPGYYYNAGTPASPNWVRFLAGRDAWLTTGNYGTTMGTNFLGTLDAQGLDFRTNGTLRLRIANGDQVLANSLGTAAIPFWSYVADPNTGLYSPAADILGFSTNGVERFRLNTTESVINEQSNDYDFRVETDGQNDMFVIDAGNDRVYFNSTTGGAGDLVSVYCSTAWNSDNPWLLNTYNSHTTGGGLYAENTNTSNGYNAMEGVTRGVYSGVYGLHITNSGLGYGVYGSSNSPSGFGVFGSSPAVVPTNTGAAGYYDWDLVCGDLWTYSDRNLKDNIKSYEGALQDVLKIEVFSFVYDQKILTNSDNRQRFGFVAQQLETVFPTFVKTKTLFSSGVRKYKSENEFGSIGQYKVVNYVEMVPVLTKAMQEQQQIIEDLKKRIEELEKANNGRK